MVVPGLLMAIWAAGTAAAGAEVARRRIVGPGFLWLTAGVMALIGGAAWLLGPAATTALGCAAGVASGLVARRPRVAAGLLGCSAVLFLVPASAAGMLTALTGSAALGGITCGMMLGHWYLVSPRMPRGALRLLAIAGAVGVGLDTSAIMVAAYPPAASPIMSAVLPALGGTGVLLMGGMWFALRQPSYTGVMAATGLSYLAILTALGSVALGRAVLV